MRGRGLKPSLLNLPSNNLIVAPHAGAWIETKIGCRVYYLWHVAPHAGAWIETIRQWRRTSKQRVAPHAGAWIETRYL